VGEIAISAHESAPEAVLNLLGAPQFGKCTGVIANMGNQCCFNRERINQGSVDVEREDRRHAVLFLILCKAVGQIAVMR
jgi:hypothetical protein